MRQADGRSAVPGGALERVSQALGAWVLEQITVVPGFTGEKVPWVTAECSAAGNPWRDGEMEPPRRRSRSRGTIGGEGRPQRGSVKSE